MAVFSLTDVGEGLTEADIMTWRVAVGDTVAVNDVLLEIETAKSVVELPSPFAGTVEELLVEEGQTVVVGTPLVRIATADDPVRDPGQPSAQPSTPESAASDHEGAMPTLVGYGPRAATSRRRRTPEVGRGDNGWDRHQPVTGNPPGRPLAKPPVRLLARELGVDLNTVAPTRPDGVITRSDVEGVAHLRTQPHEAAQSAMPELLDREYREPVKGVRKAMAQAMVASAFTAPHVTEWVEVDATHTMEHVARLRADPAYEGIHVSPLVVVAKACLEALRHTPELNARWDGEAVTFRRYVNLGIAAATPRGLLVPNVKDAADLSGPELARAIRELTDTAREGRTQPADQAGGTFTITNVGVFRVDGGTPILNPGESGILAIGAVRKKPWVVTNEAGEDALAIRWVTTLALSFDHRLVDGEKGSRFLAEVARLVHDPASLEL